MKQLIKHCIVCLRVLNKGPGKSGKTVKEGWR